MNIDQQIAQLVNATTLLTQTVLTERAEVNTAILQAGTTPGPQGPVGPQGDPGASGVDGPPGPAGSASTQATGLLTATGAIEVGQSAAPTAGHVLVASGPSSAEWRALPAPVLPYHDFTLNTSALYAQSALTSRLTGLAGTVDQPGVYRAQCSLQFASIPARVAAQCTSDLSALVSQINALGSSTGHSAAYGAGETLLPGVYTTAGASTHTGNLTFDAAGDPNAMFIIRCGAAHAVAAAASATLQNGARACNVFWLIVGAPTIGAGCSLKGTYIGQSAIAPGDVFTLEGRIFTTAGAITTSNTTYSVPVGDSALNLGVLQSFVFFTPAGAVSNTVVTGGTGDVGTGGGAITGFSAINGIVYQPTDVSSKVVFEFYKDGLAVPQTQRSCESRVYAPSQSVSLSGTFSVSAGQMVSVGARVVLGKMNLAAGNVFLMRVA